MREPWHQNSTPNVIAKRNVYDVLVQTIQEKCVQQVILYGINAPKEDTGQKPAIVQLKIWNVDRQEFMKLLADIPMKTHRHQKTKISTFSMKLPKREKVLEMNNLRVQAHAHHRSN